MFHYFTIKFHFSFSLIFASNFSLHFTWVFSFEAKQSKRNSSLFFHFFRFFHLFSLFFAFFHIFFAFFRFKFFASLWFSNFCFEAKQSEAKFKSIFSLFSLDFRFASIFSLNFRLFYLCFCFRFLVFHIEVNHVKSGFCFERGWGVPFPTRG